MNDKDITEILKKLDWTDEERTADFIKQVNEQMKQDK